MITQTPEIQDILEMDIVGESNLKQEKKFIVFKKDQEGAEKS